MYLVGCKHGTTARLCLKTETHPCAPDTAGLGLWTCGDEVITADAAARWNASRAGCQAACVDAAASLALPSQYYWATSDWGACTVQCGGGQQLRSTSCINSVDGSCASPSCRAQGHSTRNTCAWRRQALLQNIT